MDLAVSLTNISKGRRMESKQVLGFVLVLGWIGVACASSPGSRGSLPDFKVCIQLSDQATSGGDAGEERCTRWASDLSAKSDWAYDGNKYDPDAIRVKVEANTAEPELLLRDKDLRLGIRLTDNNGQEDGPIQYTPWASEGGGWSPYALDANGYDFDGVQVWIETRDHLGMRIKDLQVGVQVADGGGATNEGNPRYSKWLKDGGGWSERATDSDGYDPDAIKISLEARVPIVE